MNMNKYCGPWALSLVSGATPDHCAWVIQQYRGNRRPVCGIKNRELLSALMSLHLRVWDVFNFLYNLHMRQPQPTLAGWLRKTPRIPDAPYIVNITGHYIVVKGRKVYDNHFPKGVFLRQCPYRRKRVKYAWRVSQ